MDNAGFAHGDILGQLRRERVIDMERRLAQSRRIAFGVLATALVVSAPWFGWWTLLPLFGAGAAFAIAERVLVRSARPERWAAIGWGFSPIMIGLSVALTGGADSPAVCWFALPAVTLAARFERRGMLVGLAYTIAVMLASTFALEPSVVLADPPMLFGPLALTIAVVAISVAIGESDRDHRRDAVIDPLTGLLNRTALAQRFDDLERGRRADDGTPFAVLVGDLDHFKRINDEHGHGEGDAVLSAAAHVMHDTLRAFDLVYRVGGEEFLMILPGADIEEAVLVAGRVRLAVQECSRPGVDVTMSLGVASGTDPVRLYAEADVALYAAKRAGRDRVMTYADAEADAPLVPATP